MQLLPLVRPSGELSKDEIARYSRHLLIPDFGLEGQKCLKNSKVLVIGAGGLGSPVLLYLAAAFQIQKREGFGQRIESLCRCSAS